MDIKNLIQGLYDMKSTVDQPGNFVIITTSEIGLNKLLLESNSLSIPEMTKKIIKKHPNITPFSFKIQITFPKN